MNSIIVYQGGLKQHASRFSDFLGSQIEGKYQNGKTVSSIFKFVYNTKFLPVLDFLMKQTIFCACGFLKFSK
jgi:hypothetical protein